MNIHAYRAHFYLKEWTRSPTDEQRELIGRYGEAYAAAWLATVGGNYALIPQDRDTKPPDLAQLAGKRPDFILLNKEETTLTALDAKYHRTSDCRTFTMDRNEVGEYRSLLIWMKMKFKDLNSEVVFMVFPQERKGRSFCFVPLEAFEKPTSTLLDKDGKTTWLAVSLPPETDIRWKSLSDSAIKAAHLFALDDGSLESKGKAS